jgi:hypothetical protein
MRAACACHALFYDGKHTEKQAGQALSAHFFMACDSDLKAA